MCTSDVRVYELQVQTDNRFTDTDKRIHILFHYRLWIVLLHTCPRTETKCG